MYTRKLLRSLRIASYHDRRFLVISLISSVERAAQREGRDNSEEIELKGGKIKGNPVRLIAVKNVPTQM